MAAKKLDEKMKVWDVEFIEERPHYPHKGCICYKMDLWESFGEYAILKKEDGTFEVSTECDGIELVKQALCLLVDNAKITD